MICNRNGKGIADAIMSIVLEITFLPAIYVAKRI